MRIIKLIILVFLTGSIVSCSRKIEYREGRIVVSYWEKWTGFEKEAMQKVVDKFNDSQDMIYVDMLPVSAIDQKLIVATASGVPPDLAGVWTKTVPTLADKGAITDLTEFCREAGIGQDDFIPFIWELITHRGRVWAMMTTPATIGFYWNKRLFREAGLDPNKPPKTIDELDVYSDKLTVFEHKETGKRYTYYELVQKLGGQEEATEYIKLNNLPMIQAGFLPSEPGWWPWLWGYFFGGTMFEAPDKITANQKENIEAYKWIQTYIKKYGEYNVKKFSSGFGSFSSPQNAFLSGKIAMELQGVWLYNFIDKYSPGMQWGAAAMPTKDKEHYGMAMCEGDVLIIPQGAKCVKEAFEFIKFLTKPENMELLCSEQRKFSPLSEVTPGFYSQHKHPYIRVFRKLAENKYTFSFPRTGIWTEYNRDLTEAYHRIWLGGENPEKVLNEIGEKPQEILNLELEILRKRGKI
ncbi:MAG: ABC transporter substrate-binding protein [Elusimicrobia bacterium]|nr:ABC transporter substrate-binding protein [Elusimicrobiota bacterium]